MYKCGNKEKIGDCVSINVEIKVQEMTIQSGEIAIVLETNHDWGGGHSPLLALKFSDDAIHDLPAMWCKLESRAA
tara:strand:- start:1178 stop:1402 length:225 start_codon:yes stop_codon:yes gene_type:complete